MSCTKIKLMMLLKHEMIISREENSFRVTICYKFRIVRNHHKASRQYKDKKNILDVFDLVIRHSDILHWLRVISSLQFFQHGMQAPPNPTLLSLPSFLVSTSPIPCFCQVTCSSWKLLWALLYHDFFCWSIEPSPRLWMD